jgi:hypothetical protein
VSTPAEPPDGRTSITDIAATSPIKLADEIRAAARRVYIYAQTWRSSLSWRGDKRQRKAYECVVVAIAELDATPEVQTYRDVDRLIDIVAPILTGWWPDSTGPQRDLSEAVSHLRQVAMHQVAWVRNARSMLGQSW